MIREKEETAMNKWNLVVDVAKCENCHNCTLAVKDEFEGNEFPGYSKPQPRHGHEWIRIERRVRGNGHMVDAAYRPSMCNHCDDAPCMAKAQGAIVKRPDGIVLIDPDKAKGRKDLVQACPYGNIWWNEEEQVAQSWFFDAHLLDQGWKEPRCSQSCPTGALEAVKVTDGEMKSRIRAEGLQVLRPELGTKPRVYYKNLYRYDKCFIGGTVVTREDGLDECVLGATIILTRDGQEIARQVTDVFGDFKFDGLDPNSGNYGIDVFHPSAGKTATVATLADSIYVGEIRIG
jgi:Fe-S-cluster-containing dehydrogenase component